MLFDCIKIRKLRLSVYRKLKIIPSRIDEWFGTGDRMEDFVLLSLNKYIYHSKIADKIPSLGAFYGIITNEHKVEYNIAEKNGTMICHFKKWDKIKEIFKIQN